MLTGLSALPIRLGRPLLLNRAPGKATLCVRGGREPGSHWLRAGVRSVFASSTANKRTKNNSSNACPNERGPKIKTKKYIH